MKRLPSLKALQAFRHAGQAESFKVAAEQLHVTQAAVSQQIKILEDHLGLELFKRLTREVELTKEGKLLLPYVSKAFSTLESGIAELEKDPEPNRLTLTVLPSFASRWLVPRLGGFQEQVPDVNIHLSPSLALASFDKGDIDLAIRFGQGNYQNLTSKLLFKDNLLPVCHPSLINKELPIPEQLAELPILSDNAPNMEADWPDVQRILGLTLQKNISRLHVSDAAMLVEAVLSGQGLTMLRFSLAYELLEKGLLICPVPVYLQSTYDYYLVAPEANFKRQKVRLFEDWLRKEIQTIEDSWEQFYNANLKDSIYENKLRDDASY